MHIISKQGNQDNVITYEHICDTRADMSNIERKYITLGSVCIVLQGENDAMEVYMADSSKEWHDIIVTGSNDGGSTAGLSLHICTSSEISNGKPNISVPLEGVLYLVPSGNTSGNLYDEYVYVNNEWELFGGASIDLSGYATQSWVQQQGYLTTHQDISGKANSTDLAVVATSGSYHDLSDTPTSLSEFTNDEDYVTIQDIAGKVNSKDLAAVALSGSYGDLVDAPTNLGDLYNDVGYFSSSEDIINVLNSIDYDYRALIEKNSHAPLTFVDVDTGRISTFSSGLDLDFQGYLIKTDGFNGAGTLVVSSDSYYPILTYKDDGQDIQVGTVTADGTFTPLGTLGPLNSNS